MKTFDPHKNKTEVRQGDDRRMNLRVLVWSAVVLGLMLLALVFYLAW